MSETTFYWLVVSTKLTIFFGLFALTMLIFKKMGWFPAKQSFSPDEDRPGNLLKVLFATLAVYLTISEGIVGKYYVAPPIMGAVVVVDHKDETVHITEAPFGVWRSEHPGTLVKHDLLGERACGDHLLDRTVQLNDDTMGTFELRVCAEIVDLGKYYRDASRASNALLRTVATRATYCAATLPEFSVVASERVSDDQGVQRLATEHLLELLEERCGAAADGIQLYVGTFSLKHQASVQF